MAIRHSPGCTCCGCELFDVMNVFDEEADTTVIDGFTFIDKKLPSGGLWLLSMHPEYTGTDGVTQTVEFRLIDNSDTVVASGTLTDLVYDDPTFTSDTPERIEDRTIEIEWFGYTFEDNKKLRSLSSVFSDDPYRFNSWMIACRPRCSQLFRAASAPVFNPTIPPLNGDARDLLEGLYGRLLSSSIQKKQLADNDAPSYEVHINGGINLPNDETDILSSGPLRIGFKATADGSNVISIRCRASRIYQEPFSCESVSGYYGGEEIDQPEKNADCQQIYICPVTAPHYTTPMWEVSSASVGSGLGLSTSLARYSQNVNCAGELMYGAFTTKNTGINSNAFGGSYDGQESFAAGTVGFEFEDATKLFAYGAFNDPATLSLSAYSWRYTGTPRTSSDPLFNTDYRNPANFTGGGPLSFRLTNMPYKITYQVLATDNECEWKVRAFFLFGAWGTRGSVTSYTFPATVDNTGIVDIIGTGGIVDRWLVMPDPRGVSATLPPNYFFWSQTKFEKIVPRWDGQPPVLSFDSDDFVESLMVYAGGSIFTLSTHQFFNVANVGTQGTLTFSSGAFRMPISFTTVQFNTENIAFTLSPQVSPRMAHP